MRALADQQNIANPRGASERRRYHRNEPCNELSVVWHDDGPERTSYVRDLSLSGAFVRSQEPAPEGSLLTLRFRISGKFARAKAVVCRSAPGKGMGIKFLAIEQEDRALLAQAVDLTDERSPIPASHSTPVTAAEISEAERRTRGRLRVKVTARVEVTDVNSGEKVSAHLRSLSAGGCLLELNTSKHFSLGTSVIVRITKGTESFQSQANVIYTVPSNNIGVTFTAIDAEQLRILGAWIMETVWLAADRKKSQRVCLKVPVMITGRDVSGAPFTENTHTMKVNADGCLLALSAPVGKGHTVTLLNTRTLAMAECVVVRVEKSADTRSEIAASFLLPNKKFWQVNFPPVSD